MNATRKLTLTLLASLCALAGGLCLSGAAHAAAIHNYLFQFNEVPVGAEVTYPGPLTGGATMTVDSGHVWISEHLEGTSRFRVDEFNAANGQFIRELAHSEGAGSSPEYYDLAIGHATGEGEVYVARYHESPGVAVFSESGTEQAIWTGSDTPGGTLGAREFPGVAVDNSASLSDWASGDVYVAVPSQKVVDVFRPEAGGKEKYVTQLTGTSPSEPFTFPPNGQVQRVSVDDANGDLIVLDQDKIDLFEPTVLGEYAFVRTITPPSPTIVFHPGQVDANDGEGDIYVLGQVEENGQPMGTQVFEFNAAGAYLGRVTPASAPGGTFGFDDDVESMAADPTAHGVFVGTHPEGEKAAAPAVFAFGPNVVIPDVATAPATGLKGIGGGLIEARLNGTVNPDKAGSATCEFEWGTSASFGETVPCAAPVAEGESPAPVSAAVGGLQPDTTYSYRLQATDAHGTNPGEPWQDVQFTTPGPGLREESAAAVRAESATLEAKLNPNGSATTYYFQYGPTTAYGADAPILAAGGEQGVAAGAGEGDMEVSQHVQDLRDATVYHYRVVAASEIAPGQIEFFDGPDETFTTQPPGLPFQLPDGRAWEMVSPPHKEGALFDSIGEEGLLQASSTGDAFTDETPDQSTEPEPAGLDGGASVFFGRGPGGWTSKLILPPHRTAVGVHIGIGEEYRFFSEDLSEAVVEPFGSFIPLSPEATESTPYLHTDYLNGNSGALCTNGCYKPLVSADNVPPGTVFGGAEANGECAVRCGSTFANATPDLSYVLLESATQLTATPTEGHGLYEWSGGELALVNLLPVGESNAKGGPVAPVSAPYPHMLSNDGSHVVWLGTVGGTQHIYLRDIPLGETIRIDLPQAGAAGTGAVQPKYMTASTDGTRIFFLDGEQLTADANPKSVDLYEYNLAAPVGERLTDLSVDHNTHESAEVQAVTATSDDGAYVYFIASGALAPGALPGRCGGNLNPGEPQLCNLYLRHAGQTQFIAALSAEDQPDWSGDESLAERTTRVSPDGRWFAFMSNRSLTGYDTADALSGRPDEEVYLYDALENKLVCASCNPTGARPVGVEDTGEQLAFGGRAFRGSHTWLAASVPPWTAYRGGTALYQSRYLSDSGRMFFDSHDALVPQDVNGTQDVYEYEPAGIGDCETAKADYSERTGGCVGLISSGTSNEESVFLDASDTGGDVFFLTAARLAPQDFDNALDIYDAHECTAVSPCIAPAPAAPPPCDNADSCKPAQSLQPAIFGAGPSETFTGAGNVTSPSSQTAVKPRSRTRAQKLAGALRACRRLKSARTGAACKHRAERQYGGRAARSAHKPRPNQSAGARR